MVKTVGDLSIKFYLDEDISPVVAKLLRKQGIDCVSAHEFGMLQASDMAQLEFASKDKRCLVTRNRDDFIRLTVQFFNNQLPHFGVLIIPHSYPGDRFSIIAKTLHDYAQQYSEGMMAYGIDFI